jgi:beta-RFAP synthase
VEAPGRLHFGVLDPGGALGRSFGGIGAAAPVPPLLVSASCASSGVACEGDDSERAIEFARRFLQHHGIDSGARLRVHQSLPRHAGLGSGTQLGLAVARALAELHGCDTSAESLALAVGRTRRSGVGMWVFAGGGFVLEGGRRADTLVTPLLTRLPFPSSWRCVVAIPDGAVGISGHAEEAAFETLPSPPTSEAARVAHQVLMALLPALVEGDLAAFGIALTDIQRITGHWFAPMQGGTFVAASQHLIDELRSRGAHGVGQSSWGPAVYGLVDGGDRANALASAMETRLGGTGAVFAGPFRTAGARVWRQRE